LYVGSRTLLRFDQGKEDDEAAEKAAKQPKEKEVVKIKEDFSAAKRFLTRQNLH
jgi:hypothetical protein